MNNILIKAVNQFIGGSWEVGSSKKKGTIHNPFNNEVLAEVTLVNEVDVNEAYEIAKEAQKSWLKVPSTEKVTILKKVDLELGGNNPFIVLEDANIEEAVNAAVFGKFLHQGQVCMIINRMLVHRSLYKEFVERFVERVSKLPFGNPEDPSVIIGPLINEKQVHKVRDLVQIAKQEGATIVLEGTIEGNVVTPFVFADVSNDMKIAQSEIFGPIATIIPFDNEEEVIKFANDTAYGLSAGIFTKDIEKGRKIARQIESGMAHVNDQSVNDESMVPFGGIKSSGLGRYGGRWALEEFTNAKWISIQNNPRNYPF
ncbi:aldehyde dehydrogenase family protein [Priestia megaterium]|uniref:aldehyde dehydrogenase family protein n=1 Tax=Priestia megaterium TaxID=1404 RepID=UPI00076261BF|nr:aldehyde dehydrogenase family protein [Priestia megaterium]KWU67732.1 hypothetical protein AWX17_10170 [Priestia megaterium]